jgi:hypothetical protein
LNKIQTGGGPLLEDPPPHALSRLKLAALTASSNRNCQRRRLRQLKQQNAIAGAACGKNGLEPP